jgi:calcineurin-like phosphoesterase family protein
VEQWVTSDTHFGHENIIKFCNRPFRNAEEMDEALVANWNRWVKPEDHVRHLGDVTMWRGGKPEQDRFIRLMQRLNGHKRLIMGNHDHFPAETYLAAGFEKIQGSGQWTGDGIIYSHYPIHPSNFGRARMNVHGHIHDKPCPARIFDEQGNFKGYFNVCVEVTDYAPVHLDMLRNYMDRF